MELELAITQARKSPLVTQIDKEEVMKMITAGVSHSAMVRGQDISLNGKSFIASEVYDEIFSKYKTLSVEEIPLVFRNGVYGRYGEYFGINALTIVKWFEAYLESDERCNAVRNQMQEEKKRLMISHDESEEALAKRNEDAMRRSALDFMKQSKENEGRISGLTGLKACVFDYLVRIGKIKRADERLAVAMEEVKEQMRQRAVKMSRGVNQINSVLEMAANMGDKSLVPQAKARVLDKFYKAMYDYGRDLVL